MKRLRPSIFSEYLRQFVRGDGLRAQIMRAGVSSAGVQVGNRFAGLVLGIVAARLLGSEGYGMYALAIAVMNVLSVAAEGGVPVLLMREVAATSGRGEQALLYGALRRGIQFVLLTAVGVSVVGLSILYWQADTLSTPAYYTALFTLFMLPLSAVGKTLAHAVSGLHHIVAGQSLELLLRPVLVLLSVGTIMFLVPALREPHFVMAGQMGASVIVVLVGIYSLRRFLADHKQPPQVQYRSRAWLKSALPFALISGADILSLQADIIMLGWFELPEVVGGYRVASQGATLVAFGLQVANAVVAPHFARLYGVGDKTRLQLLATNSARLIFVAAIPIALAFIFAGDVIVTIVFGAEYASNHTALAILACGQLLSAAFGPAVFLLNMTGHERDSAHVLWVTTFMNILLNAVLIPLYSMEGAAVASVLTLAIRSIILYRLVQRRVDVKTAAFSFPSKQ